jgi:hypothetical protein
MRHFCPQRFRRHQSCHRAHWQPPVPASLAPSRECPGGRVRPAADGRACPFRFGKEHRQAGTDHHDHDSSRGPEVPGSPAFLFVKAASTVLLVVSLHDSARMMISGSGPGPRARAGRVHSGHRDHGRSGPPAGHSTRRRSTFRPPQVTVHTGYHPPNRRWRRGAARALRHAAAPPQHAAHGIMPGGPRRQPPAGPESPSMPAC